MPCVASLEGDLSALAELSLASGDLADAALDTAHEEVTSQMAEVEGRELVQIEEASNVLTIRRTDCA